MWIAAANTITGVATRHGAVATLVPIVVFVLASSRGAGLSCGFGDCCRDTSRGYRAGSGVSAPMSELITTTITSVSRRLQRVSEIAYTCDVVGHLMGTVSTLVCATSLVKTGLAASAAWVHNN